MDQICTLTAIKNTMSSVSPRTLRGLDWSGYQWNEERVGLALTVEGIAGILTQTPAGALVDRLRSKRALMAAGIVALAVGALLIALLPTLWSVMSAQILIGGTSSIFVPATVAVSLGIVGRPAFDARQGRNQTFNSTGNVTAAVSMGLLGYLTRGTGRFNLTLGAISTAVGIGAALSQVIAGTIVHHVSANAGFLFLAAVALAALAILAVFMPETRHTRLATA
jgi:MFS family permease